MKYLSVKDIEWHNISDELPSTSTDVEFLDHNNNIVPNGHIYIDMSGVYASLKNDIGYTWDSLEKYKYWRWKA